ncbi:MAG TPA: NAD-dependent epimerase/dehydratase family protein, partial [Acidimicrobiia bacterium]|nr:NAD-dependent epimerase/dehydratase family protein [Acidimicrobiia bacterium]
MTRASAVGQRVVVTGVSGFLGQRLLPLLDASPAVDHVVGLDVRDPARRARKLDFHRVDLLTRDLVPFLRGASTVVHLAAVGAPTLDEALLTRVNVDGTSAMLAAAAATDVHKIVRPSSTAIYGAWPNNPLPLTEEAPLRPNTGFLPALLDAECERRLVEWSAARD